MKKVIFLLILISLITCSKQDKINQNINTKNVYHQKAEKFRDSKTHDSAFYYYYLARANYIKNNDSVKAGESLINMALIQTTKGDFYGSIETSLIANKLLGNKKNSIVKKDLAISYNNMGIASGFLYNYNDAIKFYKKAAEYATSKEDALVCYNNIAVAYLHKNNITLARKYLNLAIQTKNIKNYSRVLNNLGKLKLLENPNYNPLSEFYKSLEIRINSKDIEGLNSSYSTLSDYFKNKEKNKSLLFAKKMLRTSAEVKNPEDQMQALQKLIELDNSNYLEYFKKFQSLNDSIIISRGKAKNQFAVIRYDVEQKDAENKNLKLQKLEDENKILILFGVLILLVSVIVLLRKRQLKLKQEKELEVKNTELRYSKKVHDKVANKVYHVMSEVENTENMNKDVLLYKLDGIYQISRDISYEKKDVALEHNFSQHLSQMLKSYSSENIKVPIIGNEESLWEDVGDHSKVEVFYILQELMTNMKKHSKADKVLIDFSRENDLINIVYSDNGIGISEFSPKNGVQNTESRINSIGGTINFDTKTENGLKITLSFPAKN